MLVRLGEAHDANGDTDAARERWREALAILTELDHRDATQVWARLHSAARDRGDAQPRGGLGAEIT